MPFRPTRIFLLISLLATTGGGLHAAESPTPPGIKPANDLVTVNGKPITQGMFSVYVRSKQKGKPNEKPDPGQPLALLTELVNFTLLEQDALADKLDQFPVVTAQLELTRMQLLARAAIANHLQNNKITEVQLKADYLQQLSEMNLNEYKVSHILLDSREKADGVIRKLQDGEDFTVVAKSNSKDPSANQGGDLGWLSHGQMDPAIQLAIEKMKPEQFSEEPVKTEFGWHILLLQEIRAVPKPSYAEMRNGLRSERQKALLSEYIVDLRSKAKIETAAPEANKTEK
ncbi:MAG: hypothetical protein GY703_18045 [Gammaproteobacteria bacterium]|nr:hypothetical protein [Gammaproteobacteria bacterium]